MVKDLFVVVRLDYLHLVTKSGIGNGVEAMFYSDSMDDASNTMELIAARDTHGTSWNPDTDGDPCFYMDNEDDEDTDSSASGLELPEERFMMWDNTDLYDPALPKSSSVKSSITVYSSIKEDSERRALRSYKLCSVSSTVKMCMDEVSEGDMDMMRQINDEAERANSARM